MNKVCLILLLSLVCVPAFGKVPLKESTFTQIINDVKIVAPDTKATRAAQMNARFMAPDLLRTGPASRAELTASDKTITRVGANTVFSYEPVGRTVRLEQGSVLFHSPKGKGGGTIKSAGASASVLGTTVIVVTTTNGGFKTIVLEGKATVRLPNGIFRVLQAGQLIFILPNANQFGPMLNINLGELVNGSSLVNGFPAELPSRPSIQNAVTRQNAAISAGMAEPTGLYVGSSATPESIQTIDPNVKAIAVAPSSSAPPGLFSDAIIDTPTLDPSRVILQHFPFDDPSLPPEIRSLSPFVGFVARNITITSPTVDLFPYHDLSFFDFLAADSIHLQQSVHFDDGAGILPLYLTGVNAVNITPGSTIRFDSSRGLYVLSGGSSSFNNVTFENSLSFVELGSGSDLTLFASRIFSPDAHLAARNRIMISSSEMGGDLLTMDADNQLDISSSTLRASSDIFQSEIELFAGGNLSLNNVTINNQGIPPSLYMAAGDTLNVNGLTFTIPGSAMQISLDARTLVLQNVNFPSGSIVDLRSQTGQLASNPNTSQPVLPGFVNFISSVDYGGSPAQNFLVTPGNAGIHIGTTTGLP